MRPEDVELGMSVQVQVRRGSKDTHLRGRVGTIRQRFGNHSHSPFEVQFGKNERLELLWASEFEEW